MAQQRSQNLWKGLRQWLQPGLGVKRWIVLLIVGITLIGLGLAIFLLDIYRANPGSPWMAVVSMAALPRWLRGLLFLAGGVGLMLFSVVRLNRSLLSPYMRPGRTVVEAVARHRRLGRGPKIVAIGGGTGLSALLRGLKMHSSNITAIVTVADDGGSSGRLRKTLGLPPPGDIRSCLAALSDDEDLLTQLFQYRFLAGEELDGHSFGNLFIAALSNVTGSFDSGILEAGKVLSIRGRVLPSTLKDVALMADKTPALDVQAIRVRGESRIPELPGQVRRVYIEPSDPPAHPEAIHDVLNADMIVIGPGSLYTSILPNLLVPDLASAVRASKAFRLYICNVATQKGETDEYDCEDHLAALRDHVGNAMVDLFVANDRLPENLPEGVDAVRPPEAGSGSIPYYTGDFLDRDRPWRHDSSKLAKSLISLLEERTGPLDLPRLEDMEPTSGPN
jgi:uncharacterized cofD-like protein